MPEVKKNVGVLRARAMLDRNSFNRETRSVDVTWATETPVLVRDWDLGDFYEILSMSAGHVRTERSAKGLPVLDDHNKYSGVSGVMGKAKDIKYSGKEARATVYFSNRSEVDGLVQDVADGIITDLSAGYRVYQYMLEGTHLGLPLMRAIDWDPFEISFTGIPKDINSSVRSQEDSKNEVVIHSLNNKTMPEENGSAASASATPAPAAAAQPAAATAPATPIPAHVAAAAASPEPEPSQRSGSGEERTRSVEILKAVRSAKLDPAFGEKLIADGVPLDKARALIIEKFAEADPSSGTRSASQVSVEAEASDKLRAGMTEALAFRANPSLFKEDPKNEFRSMTLVDMSKECLIASGLNVRGMSSREVASKALGITGERSGSMGTGDFPIILGNVVNRVLRAAYDITPRTFLPIANLGHAKDFRQMTKVQMTELSGFDKIVEGAEYTYGTFGESKEVYAISKYGKIYSITWEMIVNDDLSAFNRIPRSIGNKAAQNQSNIFWKVLTDNAAMGDGTALFHANHGNLAAAGTALSITTLSAGKAAMRKQTDGGGDFINVEPAFLVVPPELELLAYQYTSKDYVPNDQVKINPGFNSSLKVIVEPRLSANSATAWYLFSDPNQVETIEYSFLEGEGELYTEQKNGFEVDGMQIKARSTFGAKSIDWRGMYKNPGA